MVCAPPAVRFYTSYLTRALPQDKKQYIHSKLKGPASLLTLISFHKAQIAPILITSLEALFWFIPIHEEMSISTQIHNTFFVHSFISVFHILCHTYWWNTNHTTTYIHESISTVPLVHVTYSSQTERYIIFRIWYQRCSSHYITILRHLREVL